MVAHLAAMILAERRRPVPHERMIMSRIAMAITTAVGASMLLATGVAQAAPAPKPEPDQCTMPIYVGDIQLLESRPRPAEGCKAHETPVYSPQAQQRLAGWPVLWQHEEDQS